MPFSSGRLDVYEDKENPEQWVLLQPLHYKGRDGVAIKVPTTSKTDFASVPALFTWLFPRYGAYTKASILHDYLCVNAGKPLPTVPPVTISRRDADGIFRRAMREVGVPVLRRWMMWAAVRLDSRLSGAGPKELIGWLLIAIPSILFLLVPGVVVIVFLLIFWLAEAVAFLLAKVFSKAPANPPTVLLRPKQAKSAAQWTGPDPDQAPSSDP